MKAITATLMAVGLLFSQQVFSAVNSPDSVTASSTFSSYSLPDLINGSGITGGLEGGTHGVEYTDMWLSDGGDTTPWLVFDMGGMAGIGTIQIWNYNATCCGLDRGVNNLDIYYSDNDFDYTLLGNYNLIQADGSAISAQIIPANIEARYIRFEVNSNHGDELYTGLSEVAFGTDYVDIPDYDARPVPSLSFWMVMTLLLLISALAIRRLRAG